MCIVTFEEIEPGMLVESESLDTALIVDISPACLENGLFIEFFNIANLYHGVLSKTVPENEKISVIHERGTAEYKNVVNQAKASRLEYICDAQR